ncbi:MAG: ectoine/hydroxyectoine ABC transporter substrate-binding protein EhuB [Dehalococcoidia bacterium]
MERDSSGQLWKCMMSGRRLWLVLLSSLLILGLVAAACGNGEESTLEQAQEEGSIRIGFANEAPYGFADESGNVTGEAPEVAKAVLSRMGINEVDGVVVPFGSLIPGLQAGRFDVIAAGMFINPDRCDQILFSDPDYAIPQGFGVEAGNPHQIFTFADVAANPDVQLGVMAGAVEHGYAQDNGVPDSQLTVFDDTPSMAEALQAGRIDAFALTTLSVKAQLERLGDPGLEATPGFIAEVAGEPQFGAGGYGFRKSDQDLRDAFNDVLVSMKQNNEILPITEPFGFGQDEIGAARDLTAEQLCAR